MKRQSKLTSRQSEQEQQLSHQESQHTAQEFATVEAMLRHDASRTPVPPKIAHRLRESIGPETPRSWWRRLFGS
jgi:hypothetical protein